MQEQSMTEKQLAEYQPATTSGVALKERLEAAAETTAETAGDRRLLR